MGGGTLRQKLQDPTIYPDHTTTVEVQETHISLVFLTDHYAYKIKKPVDLGFLDFSTLDRRRFYCDQELELNRRLTSDVYLEVCTIHHDKGRYSFDGIGSIVEYALKMRRLSADRSLEALLQHAAVTPAAMATLAQRLAEFHAAHPLPIGIEPHDHLTQVRTNWHENFVQTTDCIGTTLSNATYGHIRQTITAFLTQHTDWFTQRVHAERIRDCHGDVRAEHIYFEPQQLQIIDCIEFNQRFRHIDVASEVAFLAVDLERLGASHLAQHFLRAYVQHSGDVSLYRLLDFYRCYRAYVRGKVVSMHLRNAPPEQAVPLQQHAETFFTVAAQYATRLTGGDNVSQTS